VDDFDVQFRYLNRGTNKNRKKKSVQPVLQQRFQAWIFQMRNMIAHLSFLNGMRRFPAESRNKPFPNTDVQCHCCISLLIITSLPASSSPLPTSSSSSNSWLPQFCFQELKDLSYEPEKHRGARRLKTRWRHCAYFPIYHWPWLCYLSKKVDCCSVDHCWSLNTEQQRNPFYR
jgi:hypothetical protein